jgi:hypothetical protein
VKIAKIKHKIFLLLLAGALISWAHPFYLSVTELKFDAAKKEMHGTVRIFVNDLEAALSKEQKGRVDLINPGDKNKATEMVTAYLLKNLRIDVDGKPLLYKVLGFEKEEESIWIYIEAISISPPTKLIVRNKILFESIKQQSNIIHIESAGVSKSAKVDNPIEVAEFRFLY